jgi:hypothetical protein
MSFVQDTRPRVAFGVVSTNRRWVNYLERTVRSLEGTGFFADPRRFTLRIFTDQECTDYIGSIGIKGSHSIHRITRAQWRGVRLSFGLGARFVQKIVWDHARALEGMPRFVDAAAIFEDDVRFASGWLPRLDRILEAVVRAHGTRWALALFVPGFHEPLDAYRRGDLFIRYPRPSVVGSQAFAYSRSVAEEMSEYALRRYVRGRDRLPLDLMIGQFCKEMGVPLLAAAPCLVQHEGKVTAGGMGGNIATPSFIERIQ